VSQGKVRFCDTDLCDHYVDRYGGPPLMEGWSTVGIGRDGTVVLAAATGGKDTGGPFLEYGRCTRAGCQHEWLPVRASSDEPFGWPELAVASAPDGAVWFALAMLAPVDRPDQQPIYTISLIRCARFPCANPERHVIDTVDRAPSDASPPSDRARLSIGADGRPVAAFAIGQSVHVVTCQPVSCADPQTSDTSAPPPNARWTAPGNLGDAVVSLQRGELMIGKNQVELEADIGSESGALAVAGADLYATVAVPTTTRQTGLRITVGSPRTTWQQILWQCERSRCDRSRRIPLDVFSGTAGRELLAVSADGQVLIVRDDHVLLLANRS
jgi:hypothetical protein